MRLGAVSATLLVPLALTAIARAEEISLRYGLRVEAGAEHDTNATRIETVAGQPSGGARVSSASTRFSSTGELLASASGRPALSLSGGLAGKRFNDEDARPEDVLVAEGRGALHFALGDLTQLALGTSYYEAFQRGEGPLQARDFRSLTPTVRVTQGLGGGLLDVSAGYRWFVFKPLAEFDFAGPTALLTYRRQHLAPLGEDAADWEWSLGAGFEWRAFSGPVTCGAEDCGPSPPDRRDRFLTFHAEAVRTGDVLVGTGLAVQNNASSSFGESLTRFVAHVRLALLLPLQLSLAARLEVARTLYPQPPPVGSVTQLVNLDDENRSILRLELTRPIGARFEIGIRYTIYRNVFGQEPVDFQRQTALAYAAFALE